MERMSEEDEAALLTATFTELEIQRVLKENEKRAQRKSEEFCLFCGDDIPEARRLAVPGVQYCVEHQDMFDNTGNKPVRILGSSYAKPRHGRD